MPTNATMLRTVPRRCPSRLYDYMAFRRGLTAGLLAAQVSRSFCQVCGEPGVSRPNKRGVSVLLIAVWLAGIWSM